MRSDHTEIFFNPFALYFLHKHKQLVPCIHVGLAILQETRQVSFINPSFFTLPLCFTEQIVHTPDKTLLLSSCKCSHFLFRTWWYQWSKGDGSLYLYFP